MTSSTSPSRTLLAAAVAAVLMFGAVSQAHAQLARERAEQRREDRKEKKEGRDEVKYPNATRESPETKASSRMASKLEDLVEFYNEDQAAEGRALADELIANDRANEYTKAFSAQLAAQLAYGADDTEAAIGYLEQALQFNGLDNNAHYDSMMMLGQLQMEQEQYEQALATFDRFLTETGSTEPKHLILKGNTLYRLERFPEAAAVLRQAVDASEQPESSWLQLLMASYFEAGQAEEATKLAARIAANSPGDKRAQMNLAAIYQQGDLLDKSAEVLEQLRASGQFTEDRDYRLLYSAYLNLDGKEKQAAEVIQEGLDKGILKPDYQTYLALAQAYYFSDQVAPAIDAYQKAAPLSPNGETYLNLARVLWQEDRIPEAKEAARQALAKGIKKPEDAKKIMALPGG